MQNPNEDTEWNDILRAKGIIPPKEKEVTEDDLVSMVENTIQEKCRAKDLSEMSKDELDELEDDIDEEEERLFQQYRQQRMQEMLAARAAAQFGSVREISKADWTTEINKAPEDVSVVVHVYTDGIPLCTLMNQHLSALASKFPATKFVRGRASVCIENYPDKNVPTVFVYRNAQIVKQWIGPLSLPAGMNTTQNDVEWMLAQCKAVTSDIEEAPRKGPEDLMDRALRDLAAEKDDGNDW